MGIQQLFQQTASFRLRFRRFPAEVEERRAPAVTFTVYSGDMFSVTLVETWQPALRDADVGAVGLESGSNDPIIRKVRGGEGRGEEKEMGMKRKDFM
ncbi:unnamed protein product [Phyllotreta striolata]|uniref:Uncharacterized protein n=1 Tax=Phyllotreta striolata TaxID=444603 RepID=A0A9N9TH63_PHYSR|nr:unnamed protein product [Phyllotreta striolata]